MSDELKPCPHCGKLETVKCMTNYEIEQMEEEDIESEPHGVCYSVVCRADAPYDGCGAAGGYSCLQSEAVAKWNRRTLPDMSADIETVRKWLPLLYAGLTPPDNPREALYRIEQALDAGRK
jgi:hypothetical protein